MAYYVLHAAVVVLWCVEVFASAYLSLTAIGRATTEAWNALAVVGLLPGLASFILLKHRSSVLIVVLFAGANLALGGAMLAEATTDRRQQMRDERTRIPFDELKLIENAVAPTLPPTAPTFEALQASRKVVQQLVKEAHAKVALAMDESTNATVKTDKTLAALERQIAFFHTDLANRGRVRGELRRRIAPRIEQMDRLAA